MGFGTLFLWEKMPQMRTCEQACVWAEVLWEMLTACRFGGSAIGCSGEKWSPFGLARSSAEERRWQAKCFSNLSKKLLTIIFPRVAVS